MRSPPPAARSSLRWLYWRASSTPKAPSVPRSSTRASRSSSGARITRPPSAAPRSKPTSARQRASWPCCDHDRAALTRPSSRRPRLALLQRVEASAGDRRGADEHRRVGNAAEEQIAPEDAPGEGDIFEWRRDIRLGEPVALPQEEEAESGDQAA